MRVNGTKSYHIEREDTIIPITVSMGDNMLELNSTTVYYDGTEVSKR